MFTASTNGNTAIAKGLKLCLISLIMMLLLHIRKTFQVGLLDYWLSHFVFWVSSGSVLILFFGFRHLATAIENNGLRTLACWTTYCLGAGLLLRGTVQFLEAVSAYALNIPHQVFSWFNYTVIDHIVLFLYLVVIVGVGRQIRMVQFQFLSMRVLRVFFMYFAWIGFELYHTANSYLKGQDGLNILSSSLMIGVYLFIYSALILYTLIIYRAAKRLEIKSTPVQVAV